MSWNKQRAMERVDAHDFDDYEVNVGNLSTTMDFANLSTKDVRRVSGVHIYVNIPNFHLAVQDAGNDKAKQKKLIRATSVLRRIQGDLLKDSGVNGGDAIGKIQIQGARMHALSFKPYGSEEKRAVQSVVMAITMNTYLYQIFNDVFSEIRNFQGSVGLSSGESLVANIGFSGDRERISLGTCANLAAKVLGLGNSITITEDIYTLLTESLQDHFAKNGTVAGVTTYKASGLCWDEQPDLVESLGVTWDEESWKEKTEEYRDGLTLSDMDVTWAEVKIDVGILSEKNSRRTDAVVIFADLDGFTDYVQKAEDNDSVVSLVRELHMIRHEFHSVLKTDYPGVVLQHQGDRVFAILHEPFGDDASDHKKRCQKAVDAAIGLQSSMDHVLKDKLTGRENLSVAIGVSVGTALVTMLGNKGKREVVCLGPEVSTAERLQLTSDGKEIRICETVYEAIDRQAIKDAFSKNNGSYVAKNLTFPGIEEAEAEKALKAGRLTTSVTEDRVHVASGATGSQSRPWFNPRQ